MAMFSYLTVYMQEKENCRGVFEVSHITCDGASEQTLTKIMNTLSENEYFSEDPHWRDDVCSDIKRVISVDSIDISI